MDSKTIMSLPFLKASNGAESFEITNTPKNLAAFVVNEGIYNDLTVTAPDDTVIISTFGPFVNKCADAGYLVNKLYPELIPMQEHLSERQTVELYAAQSDSISRTATQAKPINNRGYGRR